MSLLPLNLHSKVIKGDEKAASKDVLGNQLVAEVQENSEQALKDKNDFMQLLAKEQGSEESIVNQKDAIETEIVKSESSAISKSSKKIENNQLKVLSENLNIGTDEVSGEALEKTEVEGLKKQVITKSELGDVSKNVGDAQDIKKTQNNTSIAIDNKSSDKKIADTLGLEKETKIKGDSISPLKTVQDKSENIDLKQLLSNKQVDKKLVKEEVLLQDKIKPEVELKEQLAKKFENVISTKNNLPVNKKVSQHAYQNASLEQKPFIKTVDKAMNTQGHNVQALKSEPSKSMTLQDVMFNLEQPTEGKGLDIVSQASDVKTSVDLGQKTNNIFNINELKAGQTTDEVIAKIQDYIIQNKVDKNSQVEMSFKHQDLGKIDLLVEKMDGKDIHIKITTQGHEGHKFFQTKQTQLLQVLNQSGIQVGEFKLEMNMQQNNSNSSNGQFAQDGKSQGFFSGQKGQHHSESGQRQQESQRRQELWEQFQDKEVA